MSLQPRSSHRICCIDVKFEDENLPIYFLFFGAVQANHFLPGQLLIVNARTPEASFMNMTCANKDCGAELKYLRGGRLFLMERQPNSLVTTSSETKRTVTMRRYFWLCESCSLRYSIRRWTEVGIELAPKSKRVQIATAALPREWTLPGLVG